MPESIKDSLEIIVITYNRAKYLERTFAQIFAPESPVRDFDITVLDNKSTDNTAQVVAEYRKRFPNLKHVVNNRNIGGNANIAKAFTEAKREYLWILCDDDYYDWSAWGEVEAAVSDKADLICVSRYVCPTEEKRYSRPDLLVQLTFVPAAIYKTSNFTDSTMRNIYDALSFMFAQVMPVAEILENPAKKLYVVSRQIVENGLHVDDVSSKTEDLEIRTSYTRENDKKRLLPQTREMTWILGFSAACRILADRKLASDAIRRAVNFRDIFQSPDDMYFYVTSRYSKPDLWPYFLEIYLACDAPMREHLLRQFVMACDVDEIKSAYPLLFDQKLGQIVGKNSIKFFQKIFSIRDEGKHKVIRLLGARIRIRRKNRKGGF